MLVWIRANYILWCTWKVSKLGECMVLWGEPHEPSIQHQVYIFRQYVDS